MGNIAVESNGLPKRKQWQFWLGFFLLTVGVVCNGVALRFGNIILISSTSCFTIIFNAIFSPVMLKEKFVWKIDGVALLLVSFGSIMAST